MGHLESASAAVEAEAKAAVEAKMEAAEEAKVNVEAEAGVEAKAAEKPAVGDRGAKAVQPPAVSVIHAGSLGAALPSPSASPARKEQGTFWGRSVAPASARLVSPAQRTAPML